MNTKFTFLIFIAFLITNLNPTVAQSIFWEEDFSDGELPTGWTNEDASGGPTMWTWCGDPGSGQTGGCPGVYTGQTAFASTTADNGFAVMDSDIFGQQANNHITQLTTTAIDCSGQSEVWIKFESFIGVYENTTVNNAILKVSTNLTDWESYNLYDTPAGDFSDNPEISIVDISSEAAGSATVYLQWEWNGNYEYNWNVDDVALYDGDPSTIYVAAHDMRVNGNFFAIAPSAVTPASQIETFGFLADIENVGSVDQTNVNLNISIVDDGNSTEVYTEDKFYGTITSDSLAENQLFDGAGYTPPATPNSSFTGTYTISADSTDLIPENNTQVFSFYITDTTFAKENGPTSPIQPAGSNWEGDMEPHSWAYGNYFHTPNGDGMFARTASFGLGNASDPGVPGRLLTLYLYEWDDENVDGNADPTERVPIAFNIYEILGTETLNDLITLPLLKYPEGDLQPIPLADGGNYIIMLEYATIDEVDVSFASSDEFNYGAMVLRSDSLGAPRYGSMLGVNGDLASEPYSSLGFGYDIVPVVRMSIGDSPITTSTKDILSDENIVSISPNPAKNQINLRLGLSEVQHNAVVKIMDINGKLVLERNYEQVQHQTFSYDVSQFVSGTYFLQLITEDGLKTTRFVIAK